MIRDNSATPSLEHRDAVLRPDLRSVRGVAGGAGGGDLHGARPQRGGQDHAPQDRGRSAQGPAKEGGDPLRRPAYRRLAAGGDRPPGGGLRAGGPGALQGADRRGEPGAGALGTARHRHRDGHGLRPRDVSDPQGARPAGCGDAVGGRAADAGAGPRHAAEAAAAHARRAVAGAGPQGRQDRVRGARHHQPHRDHDPAGGAERAAGAPGGPARRHPGGGPRGARRDIAGDPAERGRPRGLSRGRGGRGPCQGVATLPQEEAMVMRDTHATTLPALFAEQVAQRGDGLAIRYKDYGIWHRVTWRQYAEEVEKVAAALLAFGLRPQENVAVLGENRPEWLYCHLGIQTARGVTCGIYPSSAPEQIEYLLNHSEARLLFIDNEEQLDKILTIVSETRIERIVVWDAKGLWGFADEHVTFFDAFLGQGTAFAETHPGAADERRR